MLSSRVISGPPNLGSGYELDAIAAVVIGGASLLGGRGTVWGTVLGLLLIQTLNNGLDILVVPAYWQKVIKRRADRRRRRGRRLGRPPPKQLNP